jgi:DNA-directed RNA polymerase subunit RPC12/RpoP
MPKEQTIDISTAETMTCPHCGNSIFLEAVVLKRLSALISPTGQEVVIPVPVFICSECKKIHPKSLKIDS